MSNYGIFCEEHLYQDHIDNIHALEKYLKEQDHFARVVLHDNPKVIDKTFVINHAVWKEDPEKTGEYFDGGFALFSSNGEIDCNIFEGWTAIYRNKKDFIKKILNAPVTKN